MCGFALAERHPAQCRVPCPLPQERRQVRRQGIGGIAVVYAVLMAWRSFSASSRCVEALGCTASHENAVPNGFAVHGCPMSGKGRTAVAIVRSESSAVFGLTYAQPRPQPRYPCR